MNLFSEECINKYYFYTDSFDDLNKNSLIKYQSDLTALNKNNNKFQTINNINSNINLKKNYFNFLHINNKNNDEENLKSLPLNKKKKSLGGESTFISSNNLLINNKTNNMELSLLSENNNKNNLNILNKNYLKNNIPKYPLNFVLFCTIDNYIQYKLNNYNLYKVYNNIFCNEKFDKNNEKKKIERKFYKKYFN